MIKKKFVPRKQGMRPTEMVTALKQGADVTGLAELVQEEQSSQPHLSGNEMSRVYAEEGRSGQNSHFPSAGPLSRDDADSLAWRAPVQPATHLLTAATMNH